MSASIGLVVDSTTDIPPEWLARWRIPVIPAFVNFSDQSFPDDGVALTRQEFYRRLAHEAAQVTTAAPPQGLAEKILRQAIEDVDHLIVSTVAARFSSIYNTVRLAAQEVAPERITVYDSGTVSLGHGWQVVAGAEARERGAALPDILDAMREARRRVEVWAAADTLEYLRRSGRVSSVTAGIGTLLQIKPIITLKEGAASTLQRVRTMRKAMQALNTLVRNAAPLEHLAILHTNFLSGAEALRAQLADVAPEETLTLDVTTAIGVHFGPGGLGVALVRAKV